ncbi:DUF6402 family protein [Burkholderia sp. Ed8]|uniref:DUF6402 family protein n=1 Tax=Burkholderia sp. Ed8 TaxID=3112957 RepID=UPI00345DD126
MDNLGWKVSAKLARIWFAGDAHIYNDDPTSTQPLNDNVVTLDWALKFGSVKRKYEKLLASDIYSERSIRTASDITKSFLKKLFSKEIQRPTSVPLHLHPIYRNFTTIGNFSWRQ